jgi:N-acetylglucosaminyl-diphospho-decaprenol L-rhamnosyltransferase
MKTTNAIIVNYKTAELTLRCVESIIKWRVTDASRILVVDNASPDESVEILSARLPSGVRLINSPRNAGYSFGVNVGLREADADLALILNPDTAFVDDSYSRVVELFERDATIGLVGLDLRNPDLSHQYSSRTFYSWLDILLRRTPLGDLPVLRARARSHLMVDAWQGGQPFDSDWVMGTGMVVPRDLFESLGGMDESFFLYMEDVDLCARVWRAERRVVVLPSAILVHDHQRASASFFSGSSGRRHLKSLWVFMKKHRVPLLNRPRRSDVCRS